jgi:hypothetical protein
MTDTQDMTTTTKNAEAAREARIAAMRARRSEGPTYGPEQTVVIPQIQAGDYVVRMTAPGFRPIRIETIAMKVTAPGVFVWQDEAIRDRVESEWSVNWRAMATGTAVIRRRVGA